MSVNNLDNTPLKSSVSRIPGLLESPTHILQVLEEAISNIVKPLITRLENLLSLLEDFPLQTLNEREQEVVLDEHHDVATRGEALIAFIIDCLRPWLGSCAAAFVNYHPDIRQYRNKTLTNCDKKIQEGLRLFYN